MQRDEIKIGMIVMTPTGQMRVTERGIGNWWSCKMIQSLTSVCHGQQEMWHGGSLRIPNESDERLLSDAAERQAKEQLCLHEQARARRRR